MFVYYNMPVLQNWDQRSAILLWIEEKECRIHEDLIKNNTAMKQRWYKGIFENVEEEQEESDENYLLEAKKNVVNF